MAKYHINGLGSPGLCKAEIQCPFGGEENHYDSIVEAYAAYEKSFEGFDVESRSSQRDDLKKLKLVVKAAKSDFFSIELEDDARSITTMSFRILPGKRIWPTWRENLYKPGFTAPPKGAHDELQRRLIELLPGWTMTSHPGELSPEGKIFRDSFLKRNPDFVWAEDRNLESDEGVDEATPHMDPVEAEKMMADTPFSKLIKENTQN